MNLPAANSGTPRGSPLPPPDQMFFIVLPDGSCTPATRQAMKIIMKQARSEATKAARIKRQEKAAQLQESIEDRAAARRYLKEMAEIDRAIAKWNSFKARKIPDKPASGGSPVIKRKAPSALSASRLRSADRQPLASSWAIDAAGFRGVMWQQAYVGRNSPLFYRGIAQSNWEYDVRDEAVLLDDEGLPITFSNMGEDWIEVGIAWQCIEDASVRKNAKIQLRIIVPFDADMSVQEMAEALNHFCTTVLEPLGLPYSAVIHKPPADGDARNYHAHLSFSLRPTRRTGPYAWDIADQVRGELDGRDGVQMLRHLWAHSMTEAAISAGRDMQYTGLGYGARGLAFEAGEHLGEAKTAMVRRGQYVAAHERNRIKAERNKLRSRIRDIDKKIGAITAIRDTLLKDAERDPDLTKWRTLVSADTGNQRPKNLCQALPAAIGPRLVASRVLPESSRTTGATILHSGSPPADETGRKAVILRESRTVLSAGRNFARLVSAPPRGSADNVALSRATVSSVRGPLTFVSSPPPSHRPLIAANAPKAPDPITTTGGQVLLELQRFRAQRGDAMALDRDRVNMREIASAPPKTAKPVVKTPQAVSMPTTMPSSTVPPEEPFRSLQQQRSQRRKATRMRLRPDAELPLPSREWYEANHQKSFDPEAEQQRLQDLQTTGCISDRGVYVVRKNGGYSLEKDGMDLMKVNASWLARPHVQHELAKIRSEQQQTLVRALTKYDLGKRPGVSFPDVMPASHRRMLERWSRADSFLLDLNKLRQSGHQHHAEPIIEPVTHEPSHAALTAPSGERGHP